MNSRPGAGSFWVRPLDRTRRDAGSPLREPGALSGMTNSCGASWIVTRTAASQSPKATWRDIEASSSRRQRRCRASSTRRWSQASPDSMPALEGQNAGGSPSQAGSGTFSPSRTPSRVITARQRHLAEGGPCPVRYRRTAIPWPSVSRAVSTLPVFGSTAPDGDQVKNTSVVPICRRTAWTSLENWTRPGPDAM